MKNAVHFVGFRDDRYWNAIKVWGEPNFIHISWDKRAQREIMEGDTVVFAKGPHDQQVREHNSPDLVFGPIHAYA